MDRFLSTTEAAEMLGVQPRQMLDWICKGIGPTWTLLGTEEHSEIVYRESDLIKFKAVFEHGIEIMPLDPDPEEVLG